MRSGLISGGIAAALAGATMMIAAASAPASAFTPSSPSLAEPVLAADIEHVWWDRWGRWHPNRPWGWGGVPGTGPLLGSSLLPPVAALLVDLVRARLPLVLRPVSSTAE